MSDNDIIRGLFICDNCVYGLDGAEPRADDIAAMERMSEIWPDHTIATETDAYASFSWSSCDGCGKTEGGDRSAAVAIPNSHFGSAYRQNQKG